MQMILDAIENGTITVYSSYPIEQGTHLIWKHNNTVEAAECMKKKIDISDVAQISPLEGQYAKVGDDIRYSRKDVANTATEDGENMSQLFTNTIHKGHYDPEFTIEA